MSPQVRVRYLPAGGILPAAFAPDVFRVVEVG